MSFYEALIRAHIVSGMLLFALALTSVSLAVMIAVKPAEDPANLKLLTRANFVGWIEISTAGIASLTGIIAMFLGSWPLTEMWLWLSLVIMLFYMSALKRVTKPSRQVVAVGGSQIKSGMQVVMHVCHMLLIIVAWSLMLLKPA